MARVPQRNNSVPLPAKLAVWSATGAALAWLIGFGLFGMIVIAALVGGAGYAARNTGI